MAKWHEKKERNQRLVAEYLSGKSLNEVGRMFGISNVAVFYFLRRLACRDAPKVGNGRRAEQMEQPHEKLEFLKVGGRFQVTGSRASCQGRLGEESCGQTRKARQSWPGVILGKVRTFAARILKGYA